MPTRRTRSGLDPRISLLILVVISFVLALLDGHGTLGLLQNVRSSAATVFSPLQTGANFISSPIVSFINDWSEVGSKDEKISKLREENSALRQSLLTVDDLERRSDQLRSMLQLAGMAGYTIVPAQVMSFGSSSGFGDTVMIDIGSDDGVKVNHNVIAGQGLVGRVINVTAHTSTVLLITDATSTVGTRIQSSGQIGFATGTGALDALKLQFIDPKATVKVGDSLVSYGVHGGVFSPGIPLGKVTAVEIAQGTTTRVATVAPYVDIATLDVVGVVIVKPRGEPRESLNPVPTAQPTVTVTVTASPTVSATISASPSESSTS
jgi:rod shape-determining protein MreC